MVDIRMPLPSLSFSYSASYICYEAGWPHIMVATCHEVNEVLRS